MGLVDMGSLVMVEEEEEEEDKEDKLTVKWRKTSLL
jgi:hypothetical protein